MDPRVRPRRLRLLAILGTVCLVVAFAGCADKPVKKFAQRYPNRGPKPGIPSYLAGSILERTDLGNVEAFPISSYGLVGQLDGTGDSTAPQNVRLWMLNQMSKHGWGNPLISGYSHVYPRQVLQDPNYAIVRVDAVLPPGARKQEDDTAADGWIDVTVTALSKNKTTSLNKGVLFETELRENGANATNPGGAITILAKAKGPIVTNPAYALEYSTTSTGPARASLRTGTVMFSGRVMQDRPIFLQLRQPQYSTARAMEQRINDRFQGPLTDHNKNNGHPGLAEAEDEGLVEVYVPRAYRGDWQHFMGVVNHMFLDGSPAFSAAKAKQLGEEALKPGAALEAISYSWEALGNPALPVVMGLLSNPRAEVAFAAARAAAYIQEPTGGAQATLLRMARTPDHPFRVPALRVLGEMPSSGSLNYELRRLLEADAMLVRLEAYRILARNRDTSINTRFIKLGNGYEKFALDVVPSNGPPIIYATRRGAPRIALIGRPPQITTPLTFTAINGKFMIASDTGERQVQMFYRGDSRHEMVKMLTRPEAAEIIARLGGEGAPSEARFDFTYGEVVAILQRLTSARLITAPESPGAQRVVAAAFVLQESPVAQDVIGGARPIEGSRPQADTRSPVGLETGGSGMNNAEVSSGTQ